VLIVTDMLGVTPKTLRHVKRYMDFRSQALAAFRCYADDVRQNRFPQECHVRRMKEAERRRLAEWLQAQG